MYNKNVSYYLTKMNKLLIHNDYVYINSHNGTDFAGNMYRLAEEILTEQYGKYKVFITVQNFEKINVNIIKLKSKYSNQNIQLILKNSKKEFEILAKAKYLFTDVDFPVPYIKKQGQIVIQTWHGTPLKKIGFDNIKDPIHSTNQKRAFHLSDFILFPNEYTKRHMIKSYRMENLINGKIIMGGYPRNSIFFDKSSVDRIKKQLGIENKRIYAYLPTWRGSLENKKNNGFILQNYLEELDDKLDDNQILFAKLHRLDKANIDFGKFSHILEFPTDYETYEFLNITDCLITDYSSVLFDYANTRKKIILFPYDKKYYIENQGMFMDMEKLPFVQVYNIGDLVKELKSPKCYDDSEFLKEFCPYD